MLIPGSVNWLLDAVDAGVQLDIRDQLRRLRADIDGVFVGVWFVDPPHQLLEHCGDRRFAPTKYPELDAGVPSLETIVSADSTKHVAIAHLVRLGRGMPCLGLVAVDAHLQPPKLIDVIDDAGARIERIIVKALVGGRRRNRP